MADEQNESKVSASFVKTAEADQLKKLIHKLRWIGQDQEAERICAQLSRLPSRETVLATPTETD